MIPRTLFTAEHEDFRKTVKRFFAEEVVPHREAWEAQQHVDRKLWNKAGELGLLCITMPEEYGGSGLGITEELLSPNLSGPLELLISTIHPGADSEFYAHDGAEAGLVMNGELELWVGDRRFTLQLSSTVTDRAGERRQILEGGETVHAQDRRIRRRGKLPRHHLKRGGVAAQVAVPGKGHEHVGRQQQTDGLQRHGQGLQESEHGRG